MGDPYSENDHGLLRLFCRLRIWRGGLDGLQFFIRLNQPNFIPTYEVHFIDYIVHAIIRFHKHFLEIVWTTAFAIDTHKVSIDVSHDHLQKIGIITIVQSSIPF